MYPYVFSTRVFYLCICCEPLPCCIKWRGTWHLRVRAYPHLVALHVLVCRMEAKSWRSVCLCDTAGSRRCEKYFSQGRRGGQHGRAVVVSNAGC